MRTRGLAATALFAAALAAGQTADELIAKNIAARGGYEKLKAVQTMRLIGTMKAGDQSLPAALELKRPNKSRWEFLVEGQTGIQAFDGKEGWTWMPFEGQTGPQPMGDEERVEAEQQADIDGPLVDSREKGEKVELVGHDAKYRPDDWKLKITLKDGDVRYVYLDPKTFLQSATVTRRKIDGVDLEVRSEVGDYRKVGDLVLPHSFTASSPGGGPSQSIQFDRIDVNVPIDDSRFAMPEPKKPAGLPGTEPTPTVG
jgi:outer membrane lipoprotein-sorting protein